MSHAKCHRESYENGGSLGVVSRLVRMNKLCWSILLEDKQKLSVGELIRVILAYIWSSYP